MGGSYVVVVVIEEDKGEVDAAKLEIGSSAEWSSAQLCWIVL